MHIAAVTVANSNHHSYDLGRRVIYPDDRRVLPLNSMMAIALIWARCAAIPIISVWLDRRPERVCMCVCETRSN